MKNKTKIGSPCPICNHPLSGQSLGYIFKADFYGKETSQMCPDCMGGKKVLPPKPHYWKSQK